MKEIESISKVLNNQVSNKIDVALIFSSEKDDCIQKYSCPRL